jgi:formamidopyrimidine-DNA glycosylase
MPELPEVEFARRLAERALVGRRIVGVAVARDPIVYEGVGARRFASALRGRRVGAVARRGKHLWLETDQRPWLVLHFGMTGRFVVYEERRDRPRFWKLELLLDDGKRLAMRNARRLGRIRLRMDPPHEPPISLLGFDALLEMPPLRAFAGSLEVRRGPIKGVLLDQRFAAGVGNWIADEVLYQARIAPQRRACDLSLDEVRRLRTKLRTVVRAAVAVEADSSRFPRSWLFHHRWGRNAEARTSAGLPIEHDTIAGRTTAWVPAVQR